VLLPEQLDASQIGIFAWETRDGQQTFLPVRVSILGHSSTNSDDVSITIRPSFDVQIMRWRWAPLNGPNCAAAGTWQDAVTYPVDAGQSVRIQLPKDTGIKCLSVTAQGSDSTWKTQPLRIALP
jgi:hypothetical protein